MRHMFAGAMGPKGFVDYFDNIMPLEKAKRRYYLKGPSGSGKSTFLKKIVASLEAEGFYTEQFHCSNDAESLDAIAVPGKGLCFMDATLPHMRDPQIPVAIDRIIDFSVFADEKKASGRETEIKQILKIKELILRKAAGYFNTLGALYCADVSAAGAALSASSSENLLGKLTAVLDECKIEKNTNLGTDRKLFLCAVTPEGPVSFAHDFFEGCTVYGLSSENNIGVDIALKRLQNEALSRGIDTESFYDPLAPDKLLQLYLPATNTAFAAAAGLFGCKTGLSETIDFGQYIDPRMLDAVKCNMECDNELFGVLLAETIDIMKESKKMHGKIEDIYADTIDFRHVNEMTEEIICDVLNWLKSQ